MGRISSLTELTSLASDDYLVVLDSSANIAKKISIANAFGIPTFGWTASGETWTYSSWSSTTRIGVITVPTDATTKYNVGWRIKITQSTGGTKYGIIVKVAATELTVFFKSGTTLNNEAISSPHYSATKIPLGFDADPTQWQLTLTDANDQTRNTPTAGTWYNQGSLSLVIGIGAWDLRFKAYLNAVVSGTSSGANATLSTANNSNSDDRFMFGLKNSTGITQHGVSGDTIVSVLLAAQTTYYVNIQATSGSNTSVSLLGTLKATRVIATCAYL